MDESIATDLADLALTPLSGSARLPAPDATETPEPLEPTERIEVTLVLRRRAPLAVLTLASYLTPAELATAYGADPDDVGTVTQTLVALGLEIVAVSPGSRRIRVGGTAERLERVFGTSLSAVVST